MFKIATWNVNSLRVRLPHVLTWLNDVKPDVVAIQETKVIDADFPLDAFQKAGYHAVFAGQKTYNGVAILSRNVLAVDLIVDIPGLDDPQRRLLGASIGNLRILNVYVPNGESIVSEKYQYKLNWLNKFQDFVKNQLEQYPNLIVLGDFNIAPEELDVHDPAAWEGNVLFSVPERELFRALLNLGLHDCFRKSYPLEKDYSWWDYRMNAFKRNLGLRIDHILSGSDFIKNCEHCYIDKNTRGWDRPSDHAPVIAEFKFS
jgi:exodeoxyribonuclease-3